MFLALEDNELVPNRSRRLLNGVLVAQQVMFVCAELNFQPSGGDGGTLEVSLIEV